MMSLNRYRLRHRAQSGKKPAQRIEALLKRPDRLIGVILIGNNFVNILASSITTVIALRLLGDSGIAWGTAILTLVILIFAEVTPKTLAVLHPERIAYPASYVLIPLLKIFYPLVWLVNSISNSLLWLLRVKRSGSHQGLSPEELRTVVYEAGARMPSEHQRMLLSILDLEKISVDDIMIPRNEVVGIDIDDSLASIVKQLKDIGVVKGIDKDAIRAFHDRAKKEQPGVSFAEVIAKGSPTGEGTESSFEYLVIPLQDRVLTPQKREDGTLDMHELGDIDSVEKGDLLMRR
ncbi:MAG: magnesium/cobalt efflux protein, partial [Gammaproteobacteria bacterium]